ncbi:MAG: mismatch-specific DNA-glycosylase [Gammaproteobacteria bacterium]
MDVLPDILIANLVTVFCGSAVGAASARRGAYYAGPGNAFWPTLFEVGLTPRRLQPEEYPSVIQFGIGLTDLAKTVSGADAILRDEHFGRDDLRRKILRYHPSLLAFTSKRAAREFLEHPVNYGLQQEQLGDTAIFVLPSPSGAARGYWDTEPWQALARLHTARLQRQTSAAHVMSEFGEK